MPHRLTRRAIVLGPPTILAAGCARPSTRPASDPSTTPGQAFAASDELVRAFGIPQDLAAMNKRTGLTTSSVTRDPYGPYLPLRLPQDHPLLRSKPVHPDPKAFGAATPEDWSERLARLAPVFITEVVDPSTLWTHDRAAYDRSVQHLLNFVAPLEDFPLPDGRGEGWGEASWTNTDGKLAKRLGAVPVRRLRAEVRTGVTDLTWTVQPHEQGPALVLNAGIAGHVLVGSVPYTWWRQLSLFAIRSERWYSYEVGYSDTIGQTLKDPLKALPVLGGHAATPADWTTEKVGSLTLHVPPALRRRPPDANGVVTFRSGDQWVDVTTGREEPDAGWNAVLGLQNTQTTTASGHRCFAEWGPKLDGDSYLCRAWVYGAKHQAAIRFTTTAATAADDLRRHAAGWHLAD